MAAEAQVVGSGDRGDACLREIPRLLTKEQMRSLSEIDSGKAMAAFAVEVLMIVAAVWLDRKSVV